LPPQEDGTVQECLCFLRAGEEPPGIAGHQGLLVLFEGGGIAEQGLPGLPGVHQGRGQPLGDPPKGFPEEEAVVGLGEEDSVLPPQDDLPQDRLPDPSLIRGGDPGIYGF
jgi:hypothetical protein